MVERAARRAAPAGRGVDGRVAEAAEALPAASGRAARAGPADRHARGAGRGAGRRAGHRPRAVLSDARSRVKGDEIDGARQVARADVEEVFDVAERLLAAATTTCSGSADDARRGKVLRVAPMTRGRPAARAAVRRAHRGAHLGDPRARRHVRRRGRARSGWPGRTRRAWTGLDVGSPFDYPEAGDAVRREAPAAARPGRHSAAAAGRAGGLVGPPAAARSACSRSMRGRARPRPRRCASGWTSRCCCQGEDQTPTLVRAFAADARDLPVRHAVAVAGRRRARARPASWW